MLGWDPNVVLLLSFHGVLSKSYSCGPHLGCILEGKVSQYQTPSWTSWSRIFRNTTWALPEKGIWGTRPQSLLNFAITTVTGLTWTFFLVAWAIDHQHHWGACYKLTHISIGEARKTHRDSNSEKLRWAWESVFFKMDVSMMLSFLL